MQWRVDATLDSQRLNVLFSAAWHDYEPRDFEPVLARSLAHVSAFSEEGTLIGFVNVASDGGHHAFLLDTTVHPAYQRRGIGLKLVREALVLAKARGAHWLHVDFAPEHTAFYRRAGFRSTAAGLIALTEER
jgi:ribosomal protein S18 acetylase RimI-like enzyme